MINAIDQKWRILRVRPMRRKNVSMQRYRPPAHIFEAALLDRGNRCNQARKGGMTDELGMQGRNTHVKEQEDQKTCARDR